MHIFRIKRIDTLIAGKKCIKITFGPKFSSLLCTISTNLNLLLSDVAHTKIYQLNRE